MENTGPGVRGLASGPVPSKTRGMFLEKEFHIFASVFTSAKWNHQYQSNIL
jgi:hypothetical protein